MTIFAFAPVRDGGGDRFYGQLKRYQYSKKEKYSWERMRP